ncbi:uncharacterized protein LOC123705982 [Colias croceus]|uniref:uncharacterized protein LOC123705982 n=1 Tax=Colias crocea TaxID=72248 RepID=UPI001E27BB15|nr:uncharacterized protein LOC123705982 [Colias croceus]
MPRRKSNLSQCSRNAKRIRLIRSQESEEDREARLSASQEHQARFRAAETSTQRESRLSSNRSRIMTIRNREISEHREARLSTDREAHALSRESETFTDREIRLSSQRVRTANARSQETQDERELRLSADREAHALSRESETFTDREIRLSSQRVRTANARSQETQDERQVRLSGNREAHALSRESETFTDREIRLSSQRVRTANARSQETQDERQVRLSADREAHALSRESETFTDREIRLSSQRERTLRSRELESSIDREYRLTADRERHNTNRLHENDDEHRERLQRARESYEQSRQSEENYLLIERERVRDIRQQETADERQSRLNADRVAHTIIRMVSSPESGTEIENLPWANKEKSGYSYSPRIDYSEFAIIGGMVVCCAFCNAFKWQKEPNGICCSGGKVLIENFHDPPDIMKALLNGEHPQSKHFLDNSRLYNSAFQMTSFGAKQITEGPFMPTFKVQGQVYHLIGSLLPQNEPKFLQIYFVSNYNEQAHIRHDNFPQLNINLISQLQNMLHQVNPYVRSFKAAIDSIPQGQNNNNYKVIIKADRRPAEEHRGRYNAPVADEVAVILVDQECDRRDIVLRTHDDRLQRIYETHRAYDALQYPLIYFHGEDGYNFGLYQVNPNTRITNYNKKISALQFYSYQIQIRRNCFNYLQRFRGLFSQFIVDMYAKIETERLIYIRTNQTRLRAEDYVHLRDAMQQDNNVENMGRLVILPSSFIGGPRYMHERTQDAFCYVRKYGRPDLFITFTTNPKWNEISEGLFDGQVPHDRHDIIARVFHLKLKLMIDLITKQKVFGPSMCFMYSVEWQKRGLPHAHILLWLEEKLRPDTIDSVISAEFPDKTQDPMLFDIVKTHMIHGPCGTLNRNSPCMQEGHCSKRYPRALTEHTISGENGYPLYRRKSPQQGGFTAKIRLHGQEIDVDNRWVVPYSPVLSRTFQAHINVEACNSVESIKYICKYVNKGSDQATVGFTNNDNDEVTRFQSGRYISSSEAVWRILSFSIHERYPPVIHLDVHLEGGQRIYFNPENVTERLHNPRRTTLLAFFNLCETDAFSRSLLYSEVPSYYTFNKQEGMFNRRRRGTAVAGEPGIFKDHVIGRVYTVHPNNSECFYLRLLLHVVRGPTSFADLRKLDNIVHPTYQAACRARHLLDGDQHWDDALSEASISESPQRLRHLFAVMLVFCALSDSAQLWNKYQNKLAEDFFRHVQLNDNPIEERLRESQLNRCLLAIQEIVTSIGGNPISQYGMPEASFSGERINRDYVMENNYDPVDLAEILQTDLSRLTDEQRMIFDRVCRSVDNALGEMLFVDAPGGTGKTFLTKVILAKVRSQGRIALAVASSGIAATLLPGGKTAHTMFKIPIDLDRTESPICNISRNSDKAKVLRDCCLIIWDESTMANRKAVEAVDRTLRDIKRNDLPMGGITMLFCGDFRQTLPVIPRGTRADEVRACLKSSRLWHYIIPLHLTLNMRAQIGGNENAQEFSDLLLDIGNGVYPQEQGKVALNENLCCKVSSRLDLISSVYGSATQIPSRANSWLCERAILTPRNDQAATINAEILSSVPGDYVEYVSINRVMEEGESTNYPVEFLESLSAPGLPAHKIKLKVGLPIILLRNLSPPKLCNGTRLKVCNLKQNIIEAEILTGCGIGETVFIPRIPLIPNNFPFSFKRVQFPVSLCFAMTINKAQGQTLKVVGVDLSISCFSHGQLYVALSRVSNPRSLYAFVPDGHTSNIVYREALL